MVHGISACSLIRCSHSFNSKKQWELGKAVMRGWACEKRSLCLWMQRKPFSHFWFHSHPRRHCGHHFATPCATLTDAVPVPVHCISTHTHQPKAEGILATRIVPIVCFQVKCVLFSCCHHPKTQTVWWNAPVPSSQHRPVSERIHGNVFTANC